MVAALALSSCARAGPAGEGFQPLLRFSVTDRTEVLERELGDGLRLTARRFADGGDGTAGWTFSVLEKDREEFDGYNLLYHSRSWHGPYPTDLLAWSLAEDYFPAERLLPVYGYPFELRLRCRACETAGEGPETSFVSGSVEVDWRRLEAPAAYDSGGY